MDSVLNTHIIEESFRSAKSIGQMSKEHHLEKDEADSLYHCPIQECEHDGFQSQRGCTKHVSTKHSWFFYFDERPNSKQVTKSLTTGRNEDETSETTKHNVKLLSLFHYHVTLAKYSRNG